MIYQQSACSNQNKLLTSYLQEDATTKNISHNDWYNQNLYSHTHTHPAWKNIYAYVNNFFITLIKLLLDFTDYLSMKVFALYSCNKKENPPLDYGEIPSRIFTRRKIRFSNIKLPTNAYSFHTHFPTPQPLRKTIQKNGRAQTKILSLLTCYLDHYTYIITRHVRWIDT